MIQAMYSGASGLRAHKTQMDVISNNIANINTIGFKASRVNFRETLSQTLAGATAPRPGGVGGTNPIQLGLGSGVGSIDVSLTQGSLLPTGKPTDVAIEGNGYLVLGDGLGKFYSRDGSLQLDADGNLVSSGTGLKVLGWTADPFSGIVDNTTSISPSSTIRLPVGQLAIARQTSNIAYGGNLDATTATDESYSVSAQLFDSLGIAHPLTVTFTKTANPGEWSWAASSSDPGVAGVAGGGNIQFDTSGRCLVNSGTIAITLAAGSAAETPMTVTLDFSSLRQLLGDSTVSPASQDGLSPGMLESFTIGKDGTISGVFTNGMNQPIGQIALARFSNPSGLMKAGSNLLIETANSGLPQIGQPAVGSMGSITAGYLESSNVDLPTEFASMIVAQRGFQANSRIITTSDEILQELVQLKR